MLEWTKAARDEVEFYYARAAGARRDIGGVQGPTKHNRKYRAFVYLNWKDAVEDCGTLDEAKQAVGRILREALDGYGLRLA